MGNLVFLDEITYCSIKNVHNLSERVDAQLLLKIMTPQGLAMAAAAGVVAGATEVAKLSVLLLRSRSALLVRSRSGYLHLNFCNWRN